MRDWRAVGVGVVGVTGVVVAGGVAFWAGSSSNKKLSDIVSPVPAFQVAAWHPSERVEPLRGEPLLRERIQIAAAANHISLSDPAQVRMISTSDSQPRRHPDVLTSRDLFETDVQAMRDIQSVLGPSTEVDAKLAVCVKELKKRNPGFSAYVRWPVTITVESDGEQGRITSATMDSDVFPPQLDRELENCYLSAIGGGVTFDTSHPYSFKTDFPLCIYGSKPGFDEEGDE